MCRCHCVARIALLRADANGFFALLFHCCARLVWACEDEVCFWGFVYFLLLLFVLGAVVYKVEPQDN